MPTILFHAESKLYKTLQQKGYGRLDAEFFGERDPDIRQSRSAFAESCRELPRDEQPGNHNRYRRYGTLILLPWSWTLEAVPPIWDAEKKKFVSFYIQSSQLNPEYGGQQRSFAPLTDEQANSKFLRHAIMTSFRAIRWQHPNQPVAVGVHLIKLVATLELPGVSSPDLIHRDGEPYTIAALIDRHGVTGGENLITVPEVANKHPSEIKNDAILERFTLDRAWDGWIVDDKRVAHYVSPVHVAEGHQSGERTVILIDFAPMAPSIPN